MAAVDPRRTVRPISILIVGAGIGGTALASFLLLAQLKQLETRFKITLLERSSSMRGLGQNIDIRSHGKDLLQKLGVDEEVRAATTGEVGARIIGSDGRPWASFAVDQSGEVETATGEIEILRGRLAEVLFKRCKELSKQVEIMGGERVEFLFGDYLDSIWQSEGLNDDGIDVHFAKSNEWKTFDIIVGADGLQSQTRQLAWNAANSNTDVPSGGEVVVSSEPKNPTKQVPRRRTSRIPEKGPESNDSAKQSPSKPSPDHLPLHTDPYLRPLDVYSAFFSIPASLLSDTDSQHPQTTTQFADGWRLWYHAPGRKSVMVRPADDKSRLTVLMIVLDPYHNDSRFQSVAAVGNDRSETVRRQKGLMSEYYQDGGWQCAKLVEGMNAADDFYYDLVAQVKMDNWSKGRVCLLGDAAHCASPFSGMGTTLALIGAYNLAGSLTKHASRSPQHSNTSEVHHPIQPSDLGAAFKEYETATRPIVTKAQKLPPGMPWLIHPQSSWELMVMHLFVAGIYWLRWLGVDKVIMKLASKGKQKEEGDKLVDWDNA